MSQACPLNYKLAKVKLVLLGTTSNIRHIRSIV